MIQEQMQDVLVNFFQDVLGIEVGVVQTFEPEDPFKTLFVNTLTSIKMAYSELETLNGAFGVDLGGFTEQYFTIIDNLLGMIVTGDEGEAILAFYLYGTDIDDTEDYIFESKNGVKYIINTAEDVWNVLNQIKDALG